jgi:hypothetical protein
LFSLPSVCDRAGNFAAFLKSDPAPGCWALLIAHAHPWLARNGAWRCRPAKTGLQKDDPMRVSGHFTALFSILGFSQSAKVQTTTAEARTIPPAEVASPQQAPSAAPSEPSSVLSLRMPVGAVPLSLGLPADRATRQML